MADRLERPGRDRLPIRRPEQFGVAVVEEPGRPRLLVEFRADGFHRPVYVGERLLEGAPLVDAAVDLRFVHVVPEVDRRAVDARQRLHLVAGVDHHIVGYGGHIHEPAQALVNGEFAYRGTLVGRYAEPQELVALVERGDVDPRTEQYDLGDVDTVAEHLEHGDIEGRAVLVPP